MRLKCLPIRTSDGSCMILEYGHATYRGGHANIVRYCIRYIHLKVYAYFVFLITLKAISMSINLRPTFGQVRNILPLKRSAPALCIRTFCSSRSQRDLEQAEIKADAPPPPTSNATIEPGDGYSTQRLANIIRADNKDKSIARPAKRQLKMPVSNHDRTAGTVIGAGKMSKTVKVRFVKQHWNRYLGKVGTR